MLPMWVTAREIRDRLGAVTAIVATMHNLSTMRELERRRIEQVLFDSEKLAATGRLAASIAHEINNPLEAIKNSLYLLVNKIARRRPELPVPRDREEGDRARLAHPAARCSASTGRPRAWRRPTSTR